jgi:recombination protein RecR
MAVERTGEHQGLYHVLHGVISPLDGIGPDDLYIRHLLQRLHTLSIDLSSVEVILATNPNVDGEATALYLHRLLKPLGVNVSRIASGIPMGSHLQYADQLSLAQALLSRRNL